MARVVSVVFRQLSTRKYEYNIEGFMTSVLHQVISHLSLEIDSNTQVFRRQGIAVTGGGMNLNQLWTG